MSLYFEAQNVSLRAGDQLKVKGTVPVDAERFHVDLGSDKDHLALHFNPRYNDSSDGSVLVCNSLSEGCWGSEKREVLNPLERGAQVKFVVKVEDDMFEVELPDGFTMNFPNRLGLDVITYVRVAGDFQLTSFKIC